MLLHLSFSLPLSPSLSLSLSLSMSRPLPPLLDGPPTSAIDSATCWWSVRAPGFRSCSNRVSPRVYVWVWGCVRLPIHKIRKIAFLGSFLFRVPANGLIGHGEKISPVRRCYPRICFAQVIFKMIPIILNYLLGEVIFGGVLRPGPQNLSLLRGLFAGIKISFKKSYLLKISLLAKFDHFC